ncbi:MAG: sporulation transcription factor Spo0A [Clostridia bacterium]|nr:sporulation transcription factor Spo0A [Clostridia bacterium]
MQKSEFSPKVIIVDSNSEFRSQCAQGLRRCGVEVIAEASDGHEGYGKIIRLKPNAVISDLYLGKIDGAQLIREVNKELRNESPVFIMAASFNNKNMFEEVSEAGAAYCMLKPIDYTVLSERIIRLSDKEKKRQSFKNPLQAQADLEAQVTKIIHEIGIPAHIKGYKFIRSAILMCVNDPNLTNAITKVVYPAVADEFYTTPSRVERAVRHSIEVAFDRGNIKVLTEYFGYTINLSKGKPTNAEFIAMIADNLRMANRSLIFAG